jgi:hypothetical protein
MAEICDPRVSIERLRQLFSYDPETGVITRLIGKTLGPISNKKGMISVDGWRATKSRVAFALHAGYWPMKLVDHKDRDQTNNRWVNLRLATPQQNQFNKVGFGKYPKGVVFKADAKRSKPWAARIRINGKKVPIGSYATMEEAEAAYNKAASAYQGEFALANSLT